MKKAQIGTDTNTIIIGDVVLVRIDLNTKFTVFQNHIAREVVGEIVSSSQLGSQKYVESLMTFEQDYKILALIYLEKGKTFTREQYERQKELILNSTIDTAEYVEVIADFFAGKGKSAVASSLSFLNKAAIRVV